MDKSWYLIASSKSGEMAKGKKKILVIDDEVALLSILSARLDFAGYETQTAKDGSDGLEKAVKFTPHLILLDLMMPAPDGFSVLTKLKENRKTRGSRVIMLTSNGETENINRAMTMGAIDYIVKPFNPVILMDKINRAMGAR